MQRIRGTCLDIFIGESFVERSYTVLKQPLGVQCHAVNTIYTTTDQDYKTIAFPAALEINRRLCVQLLLSAVSLQRSRGHGISAIRGTRQVFGEKTTKTNIGILSVNLCSCGSSVKKKKIKAEK